MAEIPTEAPRTKADKFAALARLGKSLDKQFDEPNTLIRMGEKVGIKIPSIPTGLANIDHHVIGCGGIPKGRILEVFGPESGGKTTLMLQILGEMQKAGGVGAFIDAEHALDPTWAALMGVNVDELIINQPDCAEQGLQVVDALVESRAVDLVVLDSVAGLVPQAELNGEIGDAHVGLMARLMSQALRILTAKCSRNGISVIFINQIREKIGVMYGNPETTPGGRALKFFSSVRLQVKRAESFKKGENIIGHKLKIKAVKNKCASPFREGEVDLFYDSGVDRVASLVDYAFENGVITNVNPEGKTGTTYFLNGEKLEIGKDKTKALIREDVDLQEKLNKHFTNTK